MTHGVRNCLIGSVVLAAVIAVAGCSHYLLAERAPWRQEAELACLNAGVPQEIPGRVRIATIRGPGACGIDYPLKVSELGESGTPLASTDTPPAPQAQYVPSQYVAAGAGAPMSLAPPAAGPPLEGTLDGNLDDFGGPPHPYYGGPQPTPASAPDAYTPRPLQPPLNAAPGAYPPPPPPPIGEDVTAAAGPVELKPAATLACPIVSALDQWVSTGVQPAAFKWFRQPVVEIKQIGSYACRGMINGDANAPISEHAFGDALDIAEFDLADGRRISVEWGWRGTPQEQGFLHDVQDAACRDFHTVLAPGANIYHYNHIHVDLMRRKYRPTICEPAAIPGEVAAARARAYAANHGYSDVTGSIHSTRYAPPLGYPGNDDDHRPLAVPGDD